MSRMMRNDVVIGGSSNDSAQITYSPSGRADTNVSDELDRLNANLVKVYPTTKKTFTFSNASATYIDIADIIQIDKSRIIGVTPTAFEAWGANIPTFLYDPTTGYLWAYTGALHTDTPKASFYVLYI